ncbi:MAG: BsuPI-related putative proteinase inhibitor [Candidatus Bathyarchaeia archaeon]|jgi:hypothetical protein
MKKTALALTLILALSASAVIRVAIVNLGRAQSGTATATSNPAATVASGGNGNLELTMSLDRTTYVLGEPVNLTLMITNISNQTINFTHTGLDFDFQIYNDTNNIVYQWSNFKAIPQFITIVPLQVGQSRSANFTWSQTCNFNAQVEGDTVSPGIYNIIGETGPTYRIQTTPTQLTIVKTTPTPTPTTPATTTPTPTATVLATTSNNETVDLKISGNITSSQMSSLTIATNQSAAKTTVSFTVTGEGGTTGYGNITIPISSVLYGTNPVIYIDGSQASNQGYARDSNNYYVWYTTSFSTHKVSIVFTARSSVPEFPSPVILSLVIILAVSVSVAFMPGKRMETN